MRFISMIRIEENTGQVPSEQLMSDMGKLIEELTRTGQLISTAGLRPTSEGVRVRWRRGQLSTIDGPFTETKELIAGLVDKADPDRVLPDLGALTPDPEHQMGAGVHRGKGTDPHVLEDPEHRELPVLVDQGVVGKNREIHLHLRRLGSR